MRQLHNLRHAIAAALLLLIAAASWAQASTIPVRYYQGGQRIDAYLDATGVVIVSDTAPEGRRVPLQASAATAADFDGVLPADAAAAPAGTVRPILYSTASPSPSTLPQGRLTNRFAIQVPRDQDIQRLSLRHGFLLVEAVPYAPHTYIAEPLSTSPLAALEIATRVHEGERVTFAEPLIERQQSKRLVPNDPLYSNQWHLKNTGAQVSPSTAGNDVNIETVWDFFSGTGVNIAITDDGLEITHEDLVGNVRTDIDFDFNGNDNDPSPGSSDNYHGTNCAGVAAARGNNSIGVSGAAPRSGIVGLKLISAPATDQQEANAMLHRHNDANSSNVVHINSNSWGPTDNGVVTNSGSLWKAAIITAATDGRGGKGTIFTWAGGNGNGSNDNVNYDGYANNRRVIAVGASNAAGGQASYSEPGACLLVNAPSSHGSYGITTTDLIFWGSYWDEFGGTSSACPLVAGIVALMLEANPNLTWRDVQWILATTATKNDPGNADWFNNGAGRAFNHRYGFGRANATAAVAAALTWTNRPAEQPALLASNNNSAALPDATVAGVNRSVTIEAHPTFVAESAELRVDITHSRRGDVAVHLDSPAGTRSILARMRTQDTSANYGNWVFTTKAILGEPPHGQWTANFSDQRSGTTGTFDSYTLRVYGYKDPASTNGRMTPAVRNMTAEPAQHSVFFETGSAVNWTAQVSEPWVQITNGASGTGDKTLQYTVEENQTASPRQALIVVNGHIHTINQGQGGLNCTYLLTPSSEVFDGFGGSSQFDVTAGAACAWTAQPSQPWVQITGGSAGVSNGTVNFTVAPNVTGTTRTASISVEGESFSITQSTEQPGCAFDAAPVSADFTHTGGAGQFSVLAASGCFWEPSKSADWVHFVNTPALTQGDGVVEYTVDENLFPTERTATILAGGQTHTITQSGVCIPSGVAAADLVPQITIATNRMTGKAAEPKHRLRGAVVVQNTGLLKSQKCRLSFYLSDDDVLDPATDHLMAKSLPLGAVKPGKPRTRKFNLKMTENEAAYTYLIIVVDREGVVAEQAKCNNTALREIEVEDLTKP